MCLAWGPKRSDAGKARPRGPSVSNQALYHWANALHGIVLWLCQYGFSLMEILPSAYGKFTMLNVESM